ncbi:hypothetical protein C5C74_09555 [Rathayibacter sp. AY1E8]|nr:hypothetical protein C5C74_09555 [Rathayibacter sp. AY1E8]PPI01182.1 hypothetical protein C5C95_03330 [Rathayibacter sp. AY1B7]
MGVVSVSDQLEGPFEGILAFPPDVDTIAAEIDEVRLAEWFDGDGEPNWRVLLQATRVLRSGVPELLERVRVLEQIADGRLPHTDTGCCPDPISGPDRRDVNCRACLVMGMPRS